MNIFAKSEQERASLLYLPLCSVQEGNLLHKYSAKNF